MAFALDDTIAAVASAPEGALRGIVRVSGVAAIQCVASIVANTESASNSTSLLEQSSPLTAGRVPLAIAADLRIDDVHAPLPCELFFWSGTRSYTRQPTVEIHTCGSPPLLSAVLRSVCQAGARVARPGEFTLRAFLAGRLDLTQAEAVLGIIDAHERRDLDVALRQLAGGLSGPLHALRHDLLELLAHLEAGLDFVEEDIEFLTRGDLIDGLNAAAASIAALRDRASQRTLDRHAARAVLVGRANAGKSSLFNALVEREAAIVSPLPGTTRDFLVAELNLDGARIELVDTAGNLDQPHSAIDAAAQLLAQVQRDGATVEILCLDSTDSNHNPSLAPPRAMAQSIVVETKTDRHDSRSLHAHAIRTSSTSGVGLDLLRSRLREAATNALHSECDLVAATATRARDSLRLAAEAVARAADAAAADAGDELVAAELRTALSAIGEVVGAVVTDDILDRIFSRFCIGK